MTKPHITMNDHVTLLPARLKCLEQLTEVSRRASGSTLVLVTLAEATHFNQILRALGQGFAEDFVRNGAERLVAGLGGEREVFHVSVLSFAFVVGPDQVLCKRGEPAIAAMVKRIFARPITIDSIPIKPEVGVGLMPLDDPEREAAESLRAALTAAQDSRRERAGWSWYDHKSDAAHQRAFQLLTDLMPAIERNELSLHYQPRIDLGSMKCMSCEALLRWKHPRLGWVSPGEFIPLAETTAIVVPLTEWVVQEAISQVKAWRDRGTCVNMSVNVSARNLAVPGFPGSLMKKITQAGLTADAFEIEITESTFLQSNQLVTEQIQKLRDFGIEVAIDDFGSGYSNLNYLAELNAGILKIDQSFVRKIADPAGRFLLRQIVTLGKGLGFRVVAEGVEDQGSLDFLRSLGCDEVQGYHFAKPLDKDDFARWFDGWEAQLHSRIAKPRREPGHRRGEDRVAEL